MAQNQGQHLKVEFLAQAGMHKIDVSLGIACLDRVSEEVAILESGEMSISCWEGTG